MEDKKNRKLIIVIVILIVLFSCTITLKYLNISNSKYIVIDDYIIEYNKNGIGKATYDDVIGYDFRMLHDGNYIGNYAYDHKDTFTNRLFFKGQDGVNSIKTPLLGLDSNTDYIPFEVEDMNEEEFGLYKKMTDGNISYSLKDLTYGSKIIIDNNGEKVFIYVVLYEGKNEEDSHSMIFASDGNDVYMLDEDYPQEDTSGYKFYSFNVEYVIDMNKDNRYELIVSKSHYDVTDYSIYELEGTFKEMYYTGE